MKKYEIIDLNEKLHFSRKGDLLQIQNRINEKVKEGYELFQLVSPSDCVGHVYGIFVKDEQE